jgi:hypothetical protein
VIVAARSVAFLSGGVNAGNLQWHMPLRGFLLVERKNAQDYGKNMQWEWL